MSQAARKPKSQSMENDTRKSETPAALDSMRLLSGVEALTKPDYHEMNKHAGRNDRLLHAVLCAYAKHHLDCPDIGWNKLSDILHNAICNEIGDEAYLAWGSRMNADQVE